MNVFKGKLANIFLLVFVFITIFGCQNYCSTNRKFQIYKKTLSFMIEEYNHKKGRNKVFVFRNYSQEFDDESFDFPKLKDTNQMTLIQNYKPSDKIQLEEDIEECLNKCLSSIKFVEDKNILFSDKENFKLIFDYPLENDEYACQIVHYKIGRLDANSILILLKKIENKFEIEGAYELMTI